jgi:phospholipid/cholesterol/gamma-HCH transport system substrate-binding protein
MRTRIAAGVLSLALVASGCASLGLGEQRTGTYTVTADVEQAPNLFEGGRVTVRGVEVGQITDVEPREGYVRITMELPETLDVPANARATVVPITVISDRYIQLRPAYVYGPTLRDGDHIPLSRTEIPAELDEVLTQLQGLLESIEPKEGEIGPLSKLITSLDDLMKESSDELAGTLDNASAVLENLAQSEDDITGLIRNLDRLFITLADRSSEIGLINDRFLLVAKSLARDQDNIESTIENIAFLSDEAAGLIEDSGDDIGESFGRLSRVLREVLEHQDQLALGIRWTNAIAQALGEVNSGGKGVYAYTGKQDEPGGPRAGYNYRIDQRDTISCERIKDVVSNLAVFVVPTPDNTVDTLFKFIPPRYHDHLEFLLRQLVITCVEEFNDEAFTTTVAERKVIRKAVAEFGKERVKRMIGRWFTAGFLRGPG